MSDIILFNIPAQLVFLDLLTIGAALGVGYYAARMFQHLRQGRLEKGWNLVIIGAALTACGYFFLTIEDFFLAYSFFYISVDYIGTIICTVGLVVLMLGLRSHYIAWSLGKGLGKKAESRAKQVNKDQDGLTDLR